jgi:hypothetical protein
MKVRTLLNPFNDTLGLVHGILKARIDGKTPQKAPKPSLSRAKGQSIDVLEEQTPYLTIGRGKEPLLLNVHVYQRPLQCLLVSCRKVFQPRKKGKRQLFCCPGHREEFFRLARRIGTVLLTRAASDPELNTLIQSLLTDEKKG